MEFLNTPLVEFMGYRLYPLFFLPIILIAIGVIVFFVIKNSKKDTIPSEPKVKEKKQRVKKSVVEKEVINNAEHENDYNLITAWQKQKITETLHNDLERYISENGVDEDSYTILINKMIKYIEENKYWSVADLMAISQNSVLFLTMIIAEKMEDELHYGSGHDELSLYANAIDRINGSFEKGSIVDKAWIENNIPMAKSNYNGSDDGKRMLSIIQDAMSNLVAIMEDGIIPEDEPFTDNGLQMIGESDLNTTLTELFNAQDFINETGSRSRLITLYALMYSLRIKIDALIDSGQFKVLRGVDLNILRTLAVISDEEEYSEILKTLLP